MTYGYDVSDRIQWMLDHSGPYGMAVGEAIDGVTGTFVMSSCPDWDGVFSALIMDEAGYHEEAALYLKWMSTAELRSGKVI